MSNETSKVRDRILPWLIGPLGIDVGCGPDPITPDCARYDREQGDAQLLREPVEGFDWLYSSHCLEHMPRPEEALLNWWRLIKHGGHMVILVPDEDAYEQNVWPSTFNDEHCHSFTIYKDRSWAPSSRNLGQMVAALPYVKVLSAQIVDQRPPHADRKDWTQDVYVAHIELVLEKVLPTYVFGSMLDYVVRCPHEGCGRSCILAGVKGRALHLRCEGCGGLSTFTMEAPCQQDQ